MNFPRLYLEQPAEVKMFNSCKLLLGLGRLQRADKLKDEASPSAPPAQPAADVQQSALELSTAPSFDREF
jgi:hypothetical protein